MAGAGGFTVVGGTGGNTVILGGSGDHMPRGSVGDNTVFTGSGGSTVTVGSGTSTIIAAAGDTISVGAGHNAIFGAASLDTIILAGLPVAGPTDVFGFGTGTGDMLDLSKRPGGGVARPGQARRRAGRGNLRRPPLFEGQPNRSPR